MGLAREGKEKEMRLEAVLEEAIDFHTSVLIQSQGHSIDPIWILQFYYVHFQLTAFLNFRLLSFLLFLRYANIESLKKICQKQLNLFGLIEKMAMNSSSLLPIQLLKYLQILCNSKDVLIKVSIVYFLNIAIHYFGYSLHLPWNRL